MISIRIAYVGAFALAMATHAMAQDSQRMRTDKVEVVVETVARDLQNPWSIAFLPDNRMLVTERPGRLRIVSIDGKVSAPLGGVPKVHAKGQGGLLDVALSPGFSQNRLVFLSFAEERGEGRAGTSVARGRLNEAGTALENTQVIFRQEPPHTGNNHWGSRLVFDSGGNLFVTLGERFDLRDQAQNPANLLGKLVHITPDGKPAPDNPFLNQKGTRPEIWSIGHRNVQGAALNPTTGQLWTAEHGAAGRRRNQHSAKGQKLRVADHHLRRRLFRGQDRRGHRQGRHGTAGLLLGSVDRPVRHGVLHRRQVPGMARQYPSGCAGGRDCSRDLRLNGDKITGEERMLQNLGERIRDVRQGPDGFIYLLTDPAQGRVLRMRPAD